MKTDINVLVQEAVLDCANPAGIFQKLYATFSDLTSPIDQESEIQKRLLDEGLTAAMPVPKDGVMHQEITGEGVKVIGLVLAELKLDKNDSVVIESIVKHNPVFSATFMYALGLLDKFDNTTPRNWMLLESIKKRSLT